MYLISKGCCSAIAVHLPPLNIGDYPHSFVKYLQSAYHVQAMLYALGIIKRILKKDRDSVVVWLTY